MAGKDRRAQDVLGVSLAFEAYCDYRGSNYDITKSKNYARFLGIKMLLSFDDEDFLEDKILAQEGYPQQKKPVHQEISCEEIVDLFRDTLKDKEEQ